MMPYSSNAKCDSQDKNCLHKTLAVQIDGTFRCIHCLLATELKFSFFCTSKEGGDRSWCKKPGRQRPKEICARQMCCAVLD